MGNLYSQAANFDDKHKTMTEWPDILQKPPMLHQGDKVATISLSSGLAGLFPHRYEAGKRQMIETFGLEVVETTHALRDPQWIYENPQARADDLMEALTDDSIKGIISNIGGEESVRVLPLVDLNIVRDHPKVFTGFSDTTAVHHLFMKAGVCSFFGAAVLTDFAENQGMLPYTVESIQRTLFSSEPPGRIEPSKAGWTSEYLDWAEPENQKVKRKMSPHRGYRLIQGNSTVQGRLMGGTFDVLEFLKGTAFWPPLRLWEGAILFMEFSESELKDRFPSNYLRYHMRNYASLGILERIAGIVIGRMYIGEENEAKRDEIEEEYLKQVTAIVNDEAGRHDLPILYNLNFGHTEPRFTIPYRALAEVNCGEKTFSILESGVS